MNSRITLIILFVSLSIGGQTLRQDVVDDGFTWFEAHSTTELTGNNTPTATGWTLKIWVRVLGEYPNGTKLRFVVFKSATQLFTVTCDTYAYRKGPSDLDESFARTAECWQNRAATKETGEIDVAVYVIPGGGGGERLVRKYRIDVRTVGRVPPGQGAGTEAPRYFINRHHEAPLAFVSLRPAGYVPYFDVSERPERTNENLIDLYFPLSPSDVGKNIPYGQLNCSVNGRALSFPGPMPYATQVSATLPRWYREVHQDRLAPKYKTGMPYEEEIRFQMVRMVLPLTWGRVRAGNRLAIEDFIGAWQCSVGNNDRIWRTFRWNSGVDGLPKPHPEQMGNVALGYNTYLLETGIPAGGSELDGRLAGPSASLFYGIGWRSPEGKAMAAQVPQKGEPFPVPSSGPGAKLVR
jgi:hypothetical protein